MNRHLIDYSALPSEPLGAPIRKEPAKPSPETPWKPCSGNPDYLDRINSNGIREVAHKENVTLPKASALAETAPAVAGPTEWQQGCPPEPGWYNAEVGQVIFSTLARHFDGSKWSCCVGLGPGGIKEKTAALSAHLYGINVMSWRGPRLTGHNWPEPQS
jgi:hypothetical protein